MNFLDLTKGDGLWEPKKTDAAVPNSVWAKIEAFFRWLNVSEDEDAEVFMSIAVPALEMILEMPPIEEQWEEGIKFTPLTINQGKWLRDKIANYVKLIEVSRRRLNFTPAAHATEVFGLTITPEDEELILNVVETEFSLAQGMIHASLRLRDRLERAVSKRTKGTIVQIYGSSLAEMATHKSDVDLSIFIPELERQRALWKMGGMGEQQFMKKQKQAVYGVSNDLERSGFLSVKPIPFARIPLVKCVDPRAGNPHSPDGSLHGDVCFNNAIAVRNSGLLREYARFDVRCKRLMMVVKLWIKAKKIGEAPNGTPSSYCWMNMVVYYLQVVGLLPSLQNANTYNMEKAEMINGLNVNFATAEEARKTFVQTEDEGLWTLGRLAAGFFKYYSQAFDLHTGVVSIRLPMGKAVRGSAGEGGLLTGKSLKKGQFAKTKPWRICVEDPFECLGSVFVHDLGMVVGEIGAEVMVRALEDATEILEGGAGGWGELFESSAASFMGRNTAKKGGAKKGGGTKKVEKVRKVKNDDKTAQTKAVVLAKDRAVRREAAKAKRIKEKERKAQEKDQKALENSDWGAATEFQLVLGGVAVEKKSGVEGGEGGKGEGGKGKDTRKDQERSRKEKEKKAKATKRRADRRKLKKEKAKAEGDERKTGGKAGVKGEGKPEGKPETA